jgi:RNA polymerase sigma-70 factor (ECF subfamily)
MASETAAAAAAREDAELMRRVQSGDEGACAELMGRWEVPVRAVIARVVLNASEADELAQDAFVRLWQHRARFDATKPLKPWMLGIALNLARNRLRWWKRRPHVALDEWTEADRSDGAVRGTQRAEHAERSAAVIAAIAALPVELREAIVLFEYEDMSYADIAMAVGATPKAVESRIARAREKLRVALKPWV